MLNPTAEDLAIRKAIEECGGNLTKAAEKLGVKRQKLYANVRTQRQITWWLKCKATVFSPRERARARQARYYRMRKAREAIARGEPVK